MDIVARAKAIVVSPNVEWLTIEGEGGNPAALYQSYIAILAAIPPLCAFLGNWLIGVRGPGDVVVHIGFFAGLVAAIVQYLISLAFVYVIALIVDQLAPNFSGSRNSLQALKLVAYSLTPSWLVGVFSLIPSIRGLGVLGLYSLYLFYVGAPPLMKIPQDKALMYTVVAVVCGVVAAFVISAVGGLFGAAY